MWLARMRGTDVTRSVEIPEEQVGGTMSDYPPHEYVEVRNSMGLLDPDSLEERLRRAEHHAGLLEIGLPGRQSHCWLCRRSHEESAVARRGDVMECAAYRHRWVLAYRAREETLGHRPPFEPVRVASLESWQSGVLLTDEEIADRVEELTS